MRQVGFAHHVNSTETSGFGERHIPTESERGRVARPESSMGMVKILPAATQRHGR